MDKVELEEKKQEELENKEEEPQQEENDDINDELLLDENPENALINADDNIEDFREKVRKSGVIYISHIPEGMTVSYLREKFQKYGVTRIFLTPDNVNAKGKKRTYKEGWVEFTNKLYAKLCEHELNGEVIGGKRNIPFREDMWTIKYLHKFKWHHLIEKMSFNKKLREQRMKAEISQARREANFIEDKFEQSKIVNRKNKKRQREEEELDKDNDDIDFNEKKEKECQDNTAGNILASSNAKQSDPRFNIDKFQNFKRNFKQRKPIIKK